MRCITDLPILRAPNSETLVITAPIESVLLSNLLVVGDSVKILPLFILALARSCVLLLEFGFKSIHEIVWNI